MSLLYFNFVYLFLQSFLVEQLALQRLSASVVSGSESSSMAKSVAGSATSNRKRALVPAAPSLLSGTSQKGGTTKRTRSMPGVSAVEEDGPNMDTQTSDPED